MTKAEEALKALSDAETGLSKVVADHDAKQDAHRVTNVAAALAEGKADTARSRLAGLTSAVRDAEKRVEDRKAKVDPAQQRADAALAALTAEINAGNKVSIKLLNVLQTANDGLSKVKADLQAEERALLLLLERQKDADAKAKRFEADAKNASTAEAAAKKDVTVSEGKVKAAENKVQEAIAALEAALKSTSSGVQISPEVIKMISSAGKARGRDFLTILSQESSLDPLVRQALGKFAEAEEKANPSDAIRNGFVNAGVATDIGLVTRKINSTRMTPMRRAVLARNYVQMLGAELGNPPNADKAEDTVGLADTILRKLDETPGPLFNFCNVLAADAVAQMRLDAPEGSTQRELVVAQLFSSL